MAENTEKTAQADVAQSENETATPNRLRVFVTKHPRAAKVATITGGVAAAVGVVLGARTVHSNRKHLIEAGDHAKEALTELSATVDPATDPEA